MMEESNGKRRKRRVRGPGGRVVKRPVKKPVNLIKPQLVGAFAQAEAREEAQEYLRPNVMYGIGRPDPENPAPAGDNTYTFQLPEGNIIRYFSASAQDDVNWMVVKFEVNSYNFIKGNPISLSTFIGQLNQEERPTPLTGRRWRSAVPINVVVRNISGGPAKFRSITLAAIDTECNASLKKAVSAPGFGSFKRASRVLRRSMKKRVR